MYFKEMKGRVALVTGATSGIGYESAILLAKHGVKVVLAGRNEKLGLELQNKISAFGGEALFVKTDVSNYESVKNLVNTTKKTFGNISYALNNAGTEGNLKPISEEEEIDFDELIGINLKGVWLCLKFEIQAMTKEGGSIVNISTNLTRKGAARTGLYTASKAGVESLTKVAAVESGNLNIRVNAISPGAVYTPMIKRIYTENELKSISAENPLKKIADPKDIANTALWLFSCMSSHINGDVIFVDGGSSLQG